MGTNVFIHDHAGHVDFTGWSRVWALKGHLELAMADIVDARVAPRTELVESIGWRLGGASVRGRVVAGRFPTKGRERVRQLWDPSSDPDRLVIETRLDRPWRVVLQ